MVGGEISFSTGERYFSVSRDENRRSSSAGTRIVGYAPQFLGDEREKRFSAISTGENGFPRKTVFHVLKIKRGSRYYAVLFPMMCCVNSDSGCWVNSGCCANSGTSSTL